MQSYRRLHHTDQLTLQSPFWTLSVLVLHLLLTHSCKGQSQLIGPLQSILAGVGDDIILPCYLQPALDVTTETLEWKRSDLKHIFIHVWRAGQDLIKEINPSYKGRTSLFINELKHGNISLKLSKVQRSDQGTYECDLPLLQKQSSVRLVVASHTASSPDISLLGIDRKRGAVILSCDSNSWYPEPEVVWLDGEGNLLSAGPTETVRGPDDLYTVSSRVTVEKRQSNNFTCRVQQKDINQIRETHIYISDEMFESSSSSATVGLAVSLAVCILIILLLVFFVWKRNTNRTKRKHRDQTDAGTRETLMPNETSQSFQTLKAEVEKLTEEKQQSEDAKKKLQTELDRKEKELQEEQQRRKEAEEKLQTNITELEEEREKAEKREQTLKEELETLKNQLETTKIQLESKNKELQEERKEAEKREKTLKGTTKNDLESKNKELERKEAETHNQLLKEKQERRKEVDTLYNQLETKNKELQEEQQRRKEAEEKLQTKITELDQKLRHEQQRAERAERDLEELKIRNKELTEEKKKREEAEKKVENLEKEPATKQVENVSSGSQSLTTGPGNESDL